MSEFIIEGNYYDYHQKCDSEWMKKYPYEESWSMITVGFNNRNVAQEYLDKFLNSPNEFKHTSLYCEWKEKGIRLFRITEVNGRDMWWNNGTD